MNKDSIHRLALFTRVIAIVAEEQNEALKGNRDDQVKLLLSITTELGGAMATVVDCDAFTDGKAVASLLGEGFASGFDRMVSIKRKIEGEK